ncbi:O-methyltransferase [Arcanobacterium haemolyticum]|uniref:O-methyltransferase family 3 n=1 Tax=Arcanobacterium haemolyticum (strain ATCC 9345 / DSM 20595 / CCM 5947 / CCUG 17215 / LMG 16163 / NBRC 15585 / NCTC 8452 / 11018) TaxID=644284 RepID=D7BJW6_ARCHD|nr:O-methyltransferase [Arcanobacterium haemolyticum]ADH92946.1 O-methyltransferase family 3 [Arcanobacterium haemolyticum DSM 20595]QCX47024.1 O-methyltransferase [Arcanobacterium haemolyticum]SPT75604.1 Putative O-methyltransferase MSMEG_5073 [Arcanobacterium haemolyticum]SQH28298.1 Putative O-methyltransferase MSMEG_5073 [Arcanobacterium haemolyticum]
MSIEKAQSWVYAETFASDNMYTNQARLQAAELGIEPISTATGHFLSLLCSAKGAKVIADIGTGTGVSGLYLLAGTKDSQITSIDVDSEAQNMARQNFAATGVRSGRYRLINGRSADILPRLASASYDLVLVDGDPLEAEGDVVEALRMLRTGGILVVAHALYRDRVADPARRDDHTVAMRNLGKLLQESDSLTTSLLPVGDGLLVSVKN